MPGNDKIVVSDIAIEQQRHTVTYELIFQYDDIFYRVYYDVDASYSSDYTPWENEYEIECEEVEEREVTKMEWVAIKDKEEEQNVD